MNLYLSSFILLFCQFIFPGNEPGKKATSVILIPFAPEFYISDSDNEIAKRSDLKTEKLKLMFREELDAALANALAQYQPARNLLLDSLGQEARLDIDSLHSIMSYKMADAHHPKTSQAVNNVLMKLKGKESKKEPEISEIKAPSASEQYMNIAFKKPDIFNYLTDKYSSDLFVFINQFEISTRYKTCLDLANRDYEREFTVHYSVFNSSGEQISGDIVTCIYHSNDNDFNGMVQKNFAKLANHIAKSVYHNIQ
jgi:hypothetical protein